MFITKDQKLTDLIINGSSIDEIRERAKQVLRENPNRNCNFEWWIIESEEDIIGQLKEWEQGGNGYLTEHPIIGEGIEAYQWNTFDLRINEDLPIFYRRVEINAEVKYQPIYKEDIE